MKSLSGISSLDIVQDGDECGICLPEDGGEELASEVASTPSWTLEGIATI